MKYERINIDEDGVCLNIPKYEYHKYDFKLLETKLKFEKNEKKITAIYRANPSRQQRIEWD